MGFLRIVGAGLFLLVSVIGAHAQSGCAPDYYGAIPTAAQWQQCFRSKQDALGFMPLNTNGGNMLGPVGYIGTAPTLTTCGTSPTVVGGNQGGTITMGTGDPAACTVTFATAWSSAPTCVVTWRDQLASRSYTVTTSSITIGQTATSSNKIDYYCFNVQ